MLAHLLAAADRGPALVIAPPAVVGNWAAEAARFTPGLRVIVHHGPGRAAHDEIADEVEQADVVITTYGTAVRDIDAIAKVDWACRRPRRGAGDQEPHQRDRAAAAQDRRPHARRPHRHADRERPRRPVGHPRLHQPGPRRAAAAVHRQPVRRRATAAASPGGAGGRAAAEDALRALNGILVFRRTKMEPEIQAELPDKIDQLDHCAMTAEQIGLYQAVLDRLVLANDLPEGEEPRKGQILAAITALKQICNHPAAYQDDDGPLVGSSAASWRASRRSSSRCSRPTSGCSCSPTSPSGASKLADHLTERIGQTIECYHGGLSRGVPRPHDRATSRTARARARWCCRSRPAAPGSTSPPPTTSCSTTGGGTRRWRTRPVTAPGASARPRPSSATGWCARAPSTSGSRRSWPASAASPTWCCRSRARWPTSTATSSAPRSASAPIPCSPRRTCEHVAVSPARRRRSRSLRTSRARSSCATSGAKTSTTPSTTSPSRRVITPGVDPTALVESLGPLPFPGAGLAQHYFQAVYERAAGLAVALAAAAGLLDVVPRRRRRGRRRVRRLIIAWLTACGRFRVGSARDRVHA